MMQRQFIGLKLHYRFGIDVNRGTIGRDPSQGCFFDLDEIIGEDASWSPNSAPVGENPWAIAVQHCAVRVIGKQGQRRQHNSGQADEIALGKQAGLGRLTVVRRLTFMLPENY